MFEGFESSVQLAVTEVSALTGPRVWRAETQLLDVAVHRRVVLTVGVVLLRTRRRRRRRLLLLSTSGL